MKTVDLKTTLPAREYIENFRDEERFIGFCRECGNYGRSWACPPFDFEWLPILQQYTQVTVYVTRITPEDRSLPISVASEVMRSERLRMERRLLEMEVATGGRAFAFAGKCLYCPEGSCSRIQGKPCRHPELVRPSLEAAGFDISKTVADLFGLKLEWSSDGRLPSVLTLVTALFH